MTAAHHLDAHSVTEWEDQHGSGAYARRPLTLTRGAGCAIWDDAGREYLDMTGGLGVAILGHAHPAVVAAVSQQAAELMTCPEMFYNPRRAQLYAVMSRVLPAEMGRFFLCNSGTEASEAALKLARLLTERGGVVAARRGFHGRTMGALGLTWNPRYREMFAGWTPDSVTHISATDLSDAEAAISEDTAAVFVEAVQGEGGVHPLDVDWLRGLRRLCDERGALLVVDEVQSGLGRSGRWFAFEHASIVPDVVTLGKGLAGGVPMGAVAWRDSLGPMPAGAHSSTFGGNPLASAAATATLDTLIAIDAPGRAAELGGWLIDELRGRNLPGVREVRGLGLMIGVELRGRVTPVLQGLQERGVLALSAGKTVLRLLPPLIVERDQLAQVVEALSEVLHEV